MRKRSKKSAEKDNNKETIDSSLFISSALQEHTAHVEVDLDLERRLSNLEQLATNLSARKIEGINLETLVCFF